MRKQFSRDLRPKSILTGTVVDIILDENHPRVRIYEDDDSEIKPFFTDGKSGALSIGGAIIRTLDDKHTPVEKLPIYMPNSTGGDYDLPLIGEDVVLINKGSRKLYERIPGPFLNKGVATPDGAETTYTQEEPSNKTDNYSTVSQTGTPASEEKNDKEYVFGDYFLQNKINKLKLYEGDKVLQSRFGQSIRFSAYNNEEKEFSPTIIIRNRQNDTTDSEKLEGDLIEENIVEDGSIIVLSSEKYELPFIPGTEKNQIKLKDTLYFENPNKLDGDQILINSGRIIISSKESEMMFFSKGNYSFVSDEGTLTVDNITGGAKLDFGNEVLLTTDRNSSNVWVNTGEGQIRLNTNSQGESPSTGQVEPLVRGETLKGLLEELIDLINAQIFSTPSGPTKVGPNNNGDFKDLKGRLSDFLSDYNYTE
jgi:hypothetical protein